MWNAIFFCFCFVLFVLLCFVFLGGESPQFATLQCRCMIENANILFLFPHIDSEYKGMQVWYSQYYHSGNLRLILFTWITKSKFFISYYDSGELCFSEKCLPDTWSKITSSRFYLPSHPLYHWLGPSYVHELTIIPECLSKRKLNKMRYKLINPSPNFNSAAVEVWEWIINAISQVRKTVITYSWCALR